MNSYSENQYIKDQYIRRGILNKDGSKIESNFDYNIYPWESGYIPKCSVCKEVYNKFLTNTNCEEINSPHRRCGCLWWEYYYDKMMQINNKVKFTNNKYGSK
jgi:hypothetical protein